MRPAMLLEVKLANLLCSRGLCKIVFFHVHANYYYGFLLITAVLLAKTDFIL